ncbi:unnamed protein product [Toxocara canis]|uniref:Apple domain-containing protein n=1 Tax=Toxocara canis TaxID=6265 RepID=A0A183UKJ7_TOXCA|nr:unnamed protein product [Toxocara canis]
MIETVSRFYRLNESEWDLLNDRCGRNVEAFADHKISFGFKARQGAFPWAVNGLVDVIPSHSYVVLGGSPCVYKKISRLYRSQFINLYEPMPNVRYFSDIAIFELEDPLDLDSLDVRPICLPHPNHPSPKLHRVYGYGRTVPHKKDDRANMQLYWYYEEKILDEAQCMSYRFPSIGCDRFFITRRVLGDLRSTCVGDSGGGFSGAVSGRHYLYGVITYAVNYCDPKTGRGLRYTSIFANISFNYDFICYYTGICPMGYNAYVNPHYVDSPEQVLEPVICTFDLFVDRRNAICANIMTATVIICFIILAFSLFSGGQHREHLSESSADAFNTLGHTSYLRNPSKRSTDVDNRTKKNTYDEKGREAQALKSRKSSTINNAYGVSIRKYDADGSEHRSTEISTESEINNGFVAGIPDISDICFRRYANCIIINAQPYERRSSTTLAACKHHCIHSQIGFYSCKSFVYDNINQVCDLFAHTGDQPPARFLRTQGFELNKYDEWILDGATIDECLDACANNSDALGNSIECYSVDFSKGKCVLSAERTVPLGNGQLKLEDTTDYYEKICVDESIASECPRVFDRYPQMILVGFAEVVIDSPTFEHCFDNCLNSLVLHGMRCASGMYYYEEAQLNCILNVEDRTTQKDLFTEENSDIVDYFEIRCENRGRRRSERRFKARSTKTTGEK